MKKALHSAFNLQDRLPRPEAGSPKRPAVQFDLVVEGLRKTYRDPSGRVLEVLRGVSFRVASGEMVAVMGVSGAGKSTLLHLLGGLEAADSGSASLGEFNLTRVGGAELARFRNEQVGFVFQFHRLLPDLTAAENVVLPLLIARHRQAEARSAALSLLDRVGLGQRATHRPGELSGGEQQRVAIARALVASPRLVLADEPTGNLDARAAEETGRLLASLCRERGTVTVVATHNENLAHICDRTLFLRNGQVGEKLEE